MARRASFELGWAPLGLQQALLLETLEQGIERAGREAGLLRQVVSVTPAARLREQGGEQLDGLGRGASLRSHTVISIYIEKESSPASSERFRRRTDGQREQSERPSMTIAVARAG